MTIYISFPKNGNFFGKIRILCFHYYQLQNNDNENQKEKKNPILLMHYQDWVNVVLSFGKLIIRCI